MDLLVRPTPAQLHQRGLSTLAFGETLPKAFTETFELPGNLNPKSFVYKHCSPGTYEDNGQKVKFDKGTTTIAFRFSEGVIVAVDSRASQGSYISSQTVQKVIPITDRILGTMAGGAADCLFWQRNLGTQVRLHEFRTKEKVSVAMASKLLANNMMYYKGMGLSMGTMVTGWDSGLKSAQLYYVDDDGTRLKASKVQPYFCVGSGGSYAYGILDCEYKWDMTVDEAVTLGRKAIYHATYRDGASGGVNNVYVIAGDKWEKLEPIDVYDLHDMYEDRKKNAMDTR